MKTELFLDYQRILANQAVPVHFAVKFCADAVTPNRPKPVAFCVVLDRSGSMGGAPLENAKKAAATAVRNLRRDDLFSLVVFDDTAQVVVPLQVVSQRQLVLNLISQIGTGGSTNLTGGWMLGRDELKKVPSGTARRLLLLSDGQLNVGITESTAVNRIVTEGVEQDGIRTSCLGFGEKYNEDLMAEMARVSSGQFYDAHSPEQMPTIFAAELEGLQKLAIQNLRLRIKPLDFCEALAVFGAYPQVQLPDKRIELAIGDLVSEEERIVVFGVEVLPLPCIDGKPVASLEGEKLLEIELQYDELKADSVVSKTEKRTVRIQATTNPDEVKVDEQVVSWVAVQKAGQTADAVTKKLDGGDFDGAVQLVREAIAQLKKYGSGKGVADAIRLLTDLEQQVGDPDLLTTTRKTSRYYSSSLRKMSSKEVWTSKMAAPQFKQGQPSPNHPSASAANLIPDELVKFLESARSVAVLTGAGISAESGIPTFRDALTGYWAKYDLKQLASAEGFARDPESVTRWYDERRVECSRKRPNPGHYALARWQTWMLDRQRSFLVITQTVDRLHQAAGSTDVVELHGALEVWRCTACGAEQEEQSGPFASYPPRCSCGGIRRPAVVWFGEQLPAVALKRAFEAARFCDALIVVGAGLEIHPAAALPQTVLARGAKVIEINTEATPLTHQAHWHLRGKAGEILPALVDKLYASGA